MNNKDKELSEAIEKAAKSAGLSGEEIAVWLCYELMLAMDKVKSKSVGFTAMGSEGVEVTIKAEIQRSEPVKH